MSKYITQRDGERVEIDLEDNFLVKHYSYDVLIKEVEKQLGYKTYKKVEIFSESLGEVISDTVTKSEALRMVKKIAYALNDKVCLDAFMAYGVEVFTYKRNPNWTCHYAISNKIMIDGKWSISTPETPIFSFDMVAGTITVHV